MGSLPRCSMSLDGIKYDLLRKVDPNITFAYGTVYRMTLGRIFPAADLGRYRDRLVSRIHTFDTLIPYVNALDFIGMVCDDMHADFSEALRRFQPSKTQFTTGEYVNSNDEEAGFLMINENVYAKVTLRRDFVYDDNLKITREEWGMYARLGDAVHYALSCYPQNTFLKYLFETVVRANDDLCGEKAALWTLLHLK